MNYLHIIILGLVQGLAEFLPISSSGHLVLLMNLFNISSGQMTITIMLHLGTLFAVIIYYRKDILNLITFKDKKTILNLIIATIPAVIISLLFEDAIESIFSSSNLCIPYMITTILLLVIFLRGKRDRKGSINSCDAFIMGCMQAVAIVPGISRSGATIFGGSIRNCDANEVTKFSFLMSIPAILGSIVLNVGDIISIPVAEILPMIISMLVAMISGLIAIHIMTKVCERQKYLPFAIYTLILSILSIWI